MRRITARLCSGLAIATALLMTSTSSADVVFDYSITSDGVGYFGAINLAGSVVGQVTLPDGDGTFLPILLTIDSFPAGMTGGVDTNLIPTTWAGQVGPGFTVSGGAIVDANWQGFESGGGIGADIIWFNEPNSGLNYFTLDNHFIGGAWTHVSNNDGFAGLSFSASVPEPSTVVWMVIGIGTIGLAQRRRCDKSGE